MKCLLISGLWPTKDENGLLSLSLKIKTLHPEMICEIRHWNDDIIAPYDFYIGHSFGGHKAYTLAKENQNEVKYLGLIDPVVTDWLFNWFSPGNHYLIPDNVLQAECFKRENGWLPPSSKIINGCLRFGNTNIDTNHADAPRNELIQSMILEAISKLLLPPSEIE